MDSIDLVPLSDAHTRGHVVLYKIADKAASFEQAVAMEALVRGHDRMVAARVAASQRYRGGRD